MNSFWGLTEGRFLALYAVLVLGALGIRVAIPRALDSRFFDIPTVIYLVLAATGLTRVLARYLDQDVTETGSLLGVGLTLMMGLSNTVNGQVTARRKSFWLLLVIAIAVVASAGTGFLVLGDKTSDGERIVVSLLAMFFINFTVTTYRRSGGGGGGGCGGGCGGG